VEANPRDPLPTNPAEARPPSLLPDRRVRNCNEKSIEALFTWLLILGLLFVFGGPSLLGRGSVAGVYGFVLTMVVFAPIFTIIGARGALRAIRYWREAKRMPSGFYLYLATFLSALSMFAFDAWLIRWLHH
jgi:hypothetical protein